MLKRIVAITLIAAIGFNVKVGSVVAMDTTEGYRIWLSYEEYMPNDVRYEEQTGIDMEEEAGEEFFADQLSEEYYMEFYDDYRDIFEGTNGEADSEPVGEESSTPAEPSNPPNIGDIFVPDNSFNNDFTFDDFVYNPYNPGDFNFFNPSPTPGGGSSGDYKEDETKEPGDDFLNTGKTIHYLYGEVGNYPRYVDTGIKVGEDEVIKYSHLVRLMDRVRIEQGWKLVKDANRMMVLMDKELVLLSNREYSEKDINTLFEKAGIIVRVEDTRVGGKFAIADYMEVFKELEVRINDKPITMLADPQIVNSRALISIRSIGEGLGAKVTWNDDKQEATVEKDDIKIIYSVDESIVRVNGKEALITEKTKMDTEKYRLLSVVSLIVKELDANMYWDSQNNILIINSNTPTEKVDLDKNL